MSSFSHRAAFSALAFFIYFQLGNREAKCKIIHEGLKVLSYDKNQVYNVTGILFDYNQTSKAYNLSCCYKHDLPTDLRGGLGVYVLHGETYRKLPTNLAPNVCDMFASNQFGLQSVYEYTNFRGCPIKGNVVYYVRNFMLSDDKIPQSMLIPGKFKVTVRLFSKKITYANFEWYITIVSSK